MFEECSTPLFLNAETLHFQLGNILLFIHSSGIALQPFTPHLTSSGWRGPLEGLLGTRDPGTLHLLIVRDPRASRFFFITHEARARAEVGLGQRGEVLTTAKDREV